MIPGVDVIQEIDECVQRAWDASLTNDGDRMERELATAQVYATLEVGAQLKRLADAAIDERGLISIAPYRP